MYTNVFIKNLPTELSDDELNRMASEFGEVTSAVVMRVGDGTEAFGAARMLVGDRWRSAIP